MVREILAFGTVYLDGAPVAPGTRYNGQKIELGPTVSAKRARWIYAGGKLIGSLNFLNDISWDTLNAQNLVYGREFTLSAMQVRLRLLHGDPDELGEWLELVKAAGGPVAVMDNSYRSWGQDCEEDNQNWPVAFKCVTGAWGGYYGSHEESGYGWRPVLEILSMDPTALLGKTVVATSAYGSRVSGCLESVTDYDLVLGGQVDVSHLNVQDYKFLGSAGQGEIAVDRQQLLLLEESKEEKI